MSARNNRAWGGYDNWLLQGSGVDDCSPEVFETEKHKLFSCDEDIVAKFDDEIIKIRNLTYDKASYDGYDEFFEECLFNLVDDLGLHDSEHDAIMELSERIADERQGAIEDKAERMMQARKDGEY